MLRDTSVLLLSRRTRKRRKKAKRSPRGYIPKDVGVENFFRSLNKLGVQYVCLRWHEDLPRLKDGEDIDLLVDDHDLPQIETLLTGTRDEGIPVDLYTVSGIPGTDYCTVPYFLPALARFALEQPRLFNGLVKIPHPQSYFYTMCFHVVYHKGLASGLPETGESKSETSADHDYASTLARLAQDANLPVPEMNLSELNQVLATAGWKPPTDTLRKYSRRNSWLKSEITRNATKLDAVFDGLAVFFVRERAVPWLDQIVRLLEKDGFEILERRDLKAHEASRIADGIRGGNWARGPWPVSGGKPATVLVAYDCFPRMEEVPEDPANVANTRIQRTKKRIRNVIVSLLPKGKQFNGLHSSDLPQEALEFLDLVDPELRDRIHAPAAQIIDKTKTPYPIVDRLGGNSRRAKVEVIRYKSGLAVCKVFRPNALRFLRRELLARKLLPNKGEIAPILESGENYVIMKYYKNDDTQLSYFRPLFGARWFIPVSAIQRSAELIRSFRRLGYEPIDFSPQNMIFDERDGLKVIDFEFLQKGRAVTENLMGNYAWSYPPADFVGDYPVVCRENDPYRRTWLKRTGIPLSICEYTNRTVALFVAQAIGWLILSMSNLSRRVRGKRILWT
jgi:hypothetical protein